MKRKITLSTIALYATLILLAAAYLLPAYLTVITSLEGPGRYQSAAIRGNCRRP